MQKTGMVQGAMMAVGISETDAQSFLASLTKGKVAVACVNSPSSITVSGDAAAIDELQELIEKGKLFARKLAVDVAYHSHHMALVGEEYFAKMSGIKVQEGGSIDFLSSMMGFQATAHDLRPAYWVGNILGQVKFSESVRKLCLETSGNRKGRKRGSAPAVNILIEIGPHSALAGPVKQIIQADAKLKDASIDYMTALVRD